MDYAETIQHALGLVAWGSSDLRCLFHFFKFPFPIFFVGDVASKVSGLCLLNLQPKFQAIYTRTFFSTPQLTVTAQRNDCSDSSSESSPVAQGDFAGIGVSFGADGQMSVIHGMPGNRPSPELMGSASMLMPMLANCVDYRVKKGKGGKGYSDSSVPPSCVVSM